MNDDGTKGIGDANIKGLAARAMDEPVRSEPAPPSKLRFVLAAAPSTVAPAARTPASSVTDFPPPAPSPFDREIKKARRAVEDWEQAIEQAHRDRSAARGEGDALVAEAEQTHWNRARKKRLEQLRAQYDDAVERYLLADKKRLQGKARLSSLLAVRERWLLERGGITTTPRKAP